MSEKLGLMICGHGSRNKGAVKQFAQLAEGLTARFPIGPWNTDIWSSPTRSFMTD